MRTALVPCHNRWKVLYRAAMVETNKRLLHQRVSEAETAVKARGREIFYGNGILEEKKEVLLDALRGFCAHGRTATSAGKRERRLYLNV